MDASAFISLAVACAPQVDAGTASALVAVESGFNPHAIGIVGGTLVRQPSNQTQAVATAHMLREAGWNFSVGLAQINMHTLDRLQLPLDSAFEPCRNLGAMQTVLRSCMDRASGVTEGSQQALRQALSCYYSGNFTTGFEHGYVQRVVTAFARASPQRQPMNSVSPTSTKEPR